MPDPRPEVLDFLLTRRSRPAKTLAAPAPAREDLIPLLTAAARSPDHGKLEPWRFVVLERLALDRLAGLVRARGAALGEAEETIAKAAAAYADSPLAVAVIASPKPSEKIPESEQLLSAGAVCLALLNAALAAGWGANWLTGWPVYDRGFLEDGLELAPHEQVAGVIHIGTETVTPPDRPRPDVDAITTWVRA
ncbi:Nitroreductase [Rhodovulum sp. ES.010]|uniref:nitroreductase family protein n=1 Tax=Rhodovulum sp. ES.010 TaxID=1882821 RepID=UPI00092C3D93|nr:nitroreductase family protein [Rhodovulum sp. ES.010]SIO55754.1 Nitroreductase [Rhodovulum sp. ES.010]